MTAIALVLVGFSAFQAPANQPNRTEPPPLVVRQEVLSNDIVVCGACDGSPDVNSERITSADLDLLIVTRGLVQGGVKPDVGMDPADGIWPQEAKSQATLRR